MTLSPTFRLHDFKTEPGLSGEDFVIADDR